MKSVTPRIKTKMFFRMVLGVIVFMAILFWPAGSFKFWQAWVYMAVVFVPIIFVLFYFLKKDPEFLMRRMKYKEKEKEQKLIIKISGLVFLIGFLIPGFDFRFGWSEVPPWLVIVANSVVFLGYIFIFFVFKENTYAARTIVVEEGQEVITTGPYVLVRHPMYFGVLFMFLATPLALGSFWALIAFAPTPLFLIFRTLNEEKVLLRDLPGYKEYCQKTRWRVIPFIW
jgi:protein-S-isoprenylcysteine O-methyltransferase Ste14